MIEYLVRGFLNGAVYALLALPMSLLFATAGTVDFAIGAYALIAAAVATVIPGPLGLLAGIGAALLASSVMAVIFVLIKLTGKDGPDQGIRLALASFGLSVAIASLVLLVWGTAAFVRPTFAVFFDIRGLRINPQGLINLAISVSFVLGISVLMRYTSAGRMMRAAAANPMGSELAGIAVVGLQSAAILGGGLFGGVAGLLILHSAGLDFTASLNLTFIGFAAAIIFGIRSPLRSLLGGLAMGMVQALSSGYASGVVTTLVPSLFVLLILTAGQFGSQRFAGDRP